MRQSVLVAIALASTLGSSPVSAQTRMVVGRDTLTVALRSSPGQLSAAQLRGIAPRVASLSVTPNLVHLRVGDTLALDTLVVAAHDSSGALLGNLHGADLHLRRGLVEPLFTSARLVALIPGVAELWFMFPRVYWEGRSDAPPMVDVRIEIDPAPASVRAFDGSGPPPNRDLFCTRDVDSALTILSHDYAGYGEVHDHKAREIAELVTTIRRDGRSAPSAAACSSVIAHLLDFFHDRRLTLESHDAVGGAPGGSPKYANRSPSVRYLDDSTALITLPDFRPQFVQAIDSVVRADRSRLSRTPYVVIDIRGNAGGVADAYKPIHALFATAPIRDDGTEMLASAGNTQVFRQRAASLPSGSAAANEIRSLVGRMEARPGRFVTLTPRHDIRVEDAGPMPRRVAFLIDRLCTGVCEELVLEARQSPKVILIGENTNGILDYGAARAIPLPAADRVLIVPMARSGRLPARHLDWIGIAPSIRINPASAIVAFATRELHSPGQPRPGPGDTALAQRAVASAVPQARNEAPPGERVWIAGRYDANRIIVYLDSAEFRDTVPTSARKIAAPKADGFFTPMAMSAGDIAHFQKHAGAERPEVGERLDLVLDSGHVATVSLSTLVGFMNDEGVGNSSYVGGLATLSAADLPYLTRDYYVVRRRGTSAPKTSSHVGILAESVGASEREQISKLIAARLAADSDSAVRRDARQLPLKISDVTAFTVPGGVRYYVRAVLEGADRTHVCTKAGVWLAAEPSLRITAIEPSTCTFDFPPAAERLLNVVDLGDGRVGLVMEFNGEDSRSIHLYEYRDGVGISGMRLLHSIGVAE